MTDYDPTVGIPHPADGNGQYIAEDMLAQLELDPSLEPIDLGPILQGTVIQPVPEQLIRDDGKALFYAGSVNGIHGDSGTGKGWIICKLIAENALHGRRTLLLDLEDTATSITSRLLQLGMTAYDIETWLVYVRPQVPFNPHAVDHFRGLISTHNVANVVIDSIGEAFALEGVNEDKDNEVGPWYRKVARPLADTGAAVTLVDHSTKANDNPLHPSGSKRKRAAITGASYQVEAVKPFVKGDGGRLRLTNAKDRHGNYRRGQHVADLVMTVNETKTWLELYAPMAKTEETTVPILLAARAAVKAARDEGRPLTQNMLEGLMTMKARRETKRGGIELAVARGALAETSGPRKSRLYEYVRDLEDDSEKKP